MNPSGRTDVVISWKLVCDFCLTDGHGTVTLHYSMVILLHDL